MKIHFKEIGLRKFSKTVEIERWPGFDNLLEFMCMECDPHLPESGSFELVPTDGEPALLANRYVVVHEDTIGVTRGMGNIAVSLI